MAVYLGSRIKTGALTYSQVVSARPDLKEAIDSYLQIEGKEDLILTIA